MEHSGKKHKQLGNVKYANGNLHIVKIKLTKLVSTLICKKNYVAKISCSKVYIASAQRSIFNGHDSLICPHIME